MIEFDGMELWVEARPEYDTLQWRTEMGFIPSDVPPQFARRGGMFILNPYKPEEFCLGATVFLDTENTADKKAQFFKYLSKK